MHDWSRFESMFSVSVVYLSLSFSCHFRHAECSAVFYKHFSARTEPVQPLGTATQLFWRWRVRQKIGIEVQTIKFCNQRFSWNWTLRWVQLNRTQFCIREIGDGTQSRVFAFHFRIHVSDRWTRSLVGHFRFGNNFWINRFLSHVESLWMPAP